MKMSSDHFLGIFVGAQISLSTAKRNSVWYQKALLILFFLPGLLFSQSNNLSEYIILAGDSSCTDPLNCGVNVGPNNDISSGIIGSYNGITISSNMTHGGSFYSYGKMDVSGGLSVSGNTWISNFVGDTGTVLSTGSSSQFYGDIFADGDVFINGGNVDGSVTHPSGTSYSGPVPANGEIISSYSFNSLPHFPEISIFPPAGSGKIASSQTITPGSYGDISLKGGKILTFSGTGDYVFNSISNKGSYNTFHFDFNNESGPIRLLVHGDVDLSKLKVEVVNGGGADRIFMEVHGNGSSSSSGTVAWSISPGSVGSGLNSEWKGTVWAPYGNVEIGGGSDKAVINGAVFSAKSVIMNNNLNLNHVPFDFCNTPFNVSASTTDSISCSILTADINGSSNAFNGKPSWTSSTGNIINGQNSWTATVDKSAYYKLTVTDAYGCVYTDSVFVYRAECIIPYYPPPTDGKTYDLIGSELNSLAQNTNYQDTTGHIFQLNTDSVLIEVISLSGQTQALLNLLQQPGYGLTKIIDNGPGSLIISGLYPISNLTKLDSLPNMINYVRPLFPPITNGGFIRSKGDAVMNADFVRGGYDVNGENIKVGVLSDSYNTQPGNPALLDIQNEDLPGAQNQKHTRPVNVLKEYPFGQGYDEGRAMLQIIHEIAPKAKLDFRTGYVSAGDMAQGIYELAADTCDVIVDDITFITEPFLADGVVAKAVNDVTANGVTYFTSAGNFGNKSYSSIFNGVTPPANIQGMAHDFGGGDIFQKISLGTGSYTIVLQWQDSIYSQGQTSGTNNDLDIYLTDDNGNTLFGFNRVNLNGDPIEILPFNVTTATTSNILIVRAAGTQSVPFKYVVFRGNMTIDEYHEGSSTIVGHANSEGAISVGAVFYENTPDYNNTPTVEYFSSVGGTRVNGQNRNKPDISAPDGVNTSVFLGSDINVNSDPDSYSNFFGTSAAAPHAAGIAVLLQSAKIKFEGAKETPQNIRNILTSTAIDMYSPSYDSLSGYGFVMADNAMGSFANPTPVVSEISLSDSAKIPGIDSVTIVIEGDYFTASTLVFMRDDTLTTTFLNSRHIEAEVPLFNGNPPLRAYTEPLTSSFLDGGFSDTLLFFEPIKYDVEVVVHNQTKKYSEIIPELTYTVLVDSVPYDQTMFSLYDLGLDSLNVYTIANTQSEIGNYLIRAEMPALDMSDPFDVGLTELFNYEFYDAALTIEKMPLIIAAKDTTVEYGSILSGFDFVYELEDSLIDPLQLNALTSAISIEHESKLSKGLALVNGEKLIGGRALVNADVEKLTFMASGRALVNGETIAKGYALVNGVPTLDSTYVVKIDVESIYNYQDNPDSTTTIQYSSTTSGRALVNALSLSKGYALVNGFSISKGYALVNGISFSDAKGYALVNGEPTNTDSSDVVMIVDEDDVNGSSTDTVSEFKPINLITGNKVGTHAIVPGAFINRNYNITYQMGTLTITKATLNLSADTLSTVYGDSVLYNYSTSGYKYTDTDSDVIAGPPTYTLLDANNNIVTDPSLDAGDYIIVPDSLELNEPSNYTVNYESGFLSVAAASLDVSPEPTTTLTYGDSLVIDVSFTGFKYDDSELTTVVSGPDLVLTDAASNVADNTKVPAGSYTVSLNNLVLSNPSNYNVNFQTGNLIVDKSELQVVVLDTNKIYGEINPTFTLTYSGFKYDDDETNIVTPVASTVATTSSFTGNYPIELSSNGLSSNYFLSFTNGNLEILPSEVIVTADDKFVDRGDTVSNLTYTMSGIINPSDYVLSGPNYSIDPNYYTTAGTYDIVPSNLILTNSSNYIVNYLNGTLYVNPKGRGAKNIKPSLECVDTLIGHPSGYSYVAHYSYENKNSTPVYIPIGPENEIIATGNYIGSQPEVFAAGGGFFDIVFDGQKMTWEVTTYQGNQKASTASQASSTSNKCNSGSNKTSFDEDRIAIAYPNPVNDILMIQGFESSEVQEVQIFSLSGEFIAGNIQVKGDNGLMLIDFSQFENGLYIVNIVSNDGIEMFKIMKE